LVADVLIQYKLDLLTKL